MGKSVETGNNPTVSDSQITVVIVRQTPSSLRTSRRAAHVCLRLIQSSRLRQKTNCILISKGRRSSRDAPITSDVLINSYKEEDAEFDMGSLWDHDDLHLISTLCIH